jgi:hypothetical protein
MEQIDDGRRNIIIHPNKEPEDLPLKGVQELPKVRSSESFVPANMDEPTIYPGDVVVGVFDGNVEYAELVQKKVEGGVLVLSLQTGVPTVYDDQDFSARMYQSDEIHVYDDVAERGNEWNITTDESKLERPGGRRR